MNGAFICGLVIGFTCGFLTITTLLIDVLRPIFPDSIRRENEEK